MRGEGPPLVLAHGIGLNSLVWFQQVPRFARDHRVISYDLRGFGRSPCEREDLDLRLAGEDLRRVCDAAGAERVAVIGHSIGAVAGLRLALDYPERVSCLVLCSSAGGIITQKLLQSISQAASEYARSGPTQRFVLSAGFVQRAPAEAFLLQRLFELSPPFDPAIMSSVIDARVHEVELAGFAIPTLVIAGGRDIMFPAEALAEAAAWIPGTKVVAFDNSGHLPFYEEPERFNRVASDFIRRHPPL